jgi:hypothetical protein
MPSTEKTSKRVWLGPLTGITFLAIGLTGILMFFHVRLPGATQLHELGGILFVIVGVLHVQLNWRALLAYCSRRAGRIALAVGAALIVIFVGLGLHHEDRHQRHGGPCVSATTGQRQ